MTTEEITPIAIGEKAPDFTLEDVLSGVPVTLSETNVDDVVVLNFWSCECPWTRHYDDYFAERAQQWAERGVRLIHINSNANEPPAETERVANELDIVQPILDDPANIVADEYGALMTPHVFVINREGRVAYQGAVDDRSFRQREASVNYLDHAIDAVLAGNQPDPAATEAYGCTIVREFDEAE